MQSSLFNFFTKTPKQEKKSSPDYDVSDDVLSGDIFEQPFEVESTPIKLEVKECLSPIIKNKRRRLILDSSDEEDLNDKSVDPIIESRSNGTSTTINGEIFRKFGRELTNSSPKQRHKVELDVSSRLDDTTTSLDTSSFRTEDDSFAADCTIDEMTQDSWPHLTLPFLQPNKITDVYGHRPNHPDYDSHTVHVPEDYIKKQSPGMRQWWILKSKNFDTILFFKVGKFYELYHQDAIVAVEELRLSLMRGNFAHSGFPETAFQKMADRLLQKGYKVARVEQTETPENLAKRISGKPGSDKVVRREICQIITPGTWFANLRGEICDANKLENCTPVPSDLEPEVSSDRHLLVILEASNRGNLDGDNIVGVAILKTATGEIMIGQFNDDVHFSRMCTAIAHYPPSQILFERGNLSSKLRRILKARLPGVPFECLSSGKQFLSANETLSTIESANYFSLAKNSNSEETKSGCESNKNSTKYSADWPEDLVKMLDPTDNLGRTPLAEYELAIRCLGAVVYYLKYCLSDVEILSLCQITEYQPIDIINEKNRDSLQPFYERQINMILDSITLDNLEILSGDSSRSIEGTLLERLDTCCTPFGRRLMRSWLVNPPCNPSTITKRQDSIEELMQLNPQLNTIRDGLRRLPDLERLLTKVHLMGWNATSPEHPDSRAVLFEENVYSKRKMSDFLATLTGFKSAQKIITEISHFDITSEYLHSITNFRSNGGSFPCCKERLAMFEKAFDHEQARLDGRVVVEPGFDREYDTACRDLKEAEHRLDEYLSEQSEVIGTRLTYCGTGKNRFQIEVPDSHVKRVPPNWEATSQKKGYKRYRTPIVMKLFSELVNAEDFKVETTQGIMRRIFASFSSSYKDWSAAVRCLSELDCLMSLANYSSTAAAITCRPKFYSLDSVFQKPFLEIINGSHPCLLNIFSGKDVTPNDINLGSIPRNDQFTVSGFKPGITSLLITGANMGGKSTLMRQTALLVILAHLGCHIPATSCQLTPIDRIFTRIGASDRLISGQSTFYVELAETAIIIKHASPQSLVLIDELGRGTSTRDGSSLAGSVLRYISKPRGNASGPLTLFSTHYHGLADALQNRLTITDQAIDVGHMQCLVGDQDSGNKDSEKITFLYKLIPTACPKSYGFNVAHLAHVPEEIINNGVAMANEFEKATLVFSCLRDILAKKMNREEAIAWKLRLQSLGNESIYGETATLSS